MLIEILKFVIAVGVGAVTACLTVLSCIVVALILMGWSQNN
jgi:hypothetical protein